MKTLTMKTVTALMLLSAPLALSPAWSADSPAQGAAAGAGATRPASNAHVLSKAELDQLLAQPDKVLVIDVRRPDEISANGGLPVYLSIQVGDLEKELAWIPKDRTIITLSNHAARASKAADLLSSHGFKVAGAAGAETYEKDGGVLTRVAIPPPRAAGTNAAP
jgi:rhodanese-related sulfurtransferase